MSNTVFVLGAGASKKAGVPLMADFLDVAHSRWKQGEVNDTDKHFSDVFRAVSCLQSVHSKSQLDINNIESVFSTLETAKTLRKLPGFEVDTIDRLVESLKMVISRTIESTLIFPVASKRVQSPEPYGTFAELVKHLRDEARPKQSVAVLTFNYDLACDFAFHQYGVHADYALDEHVARDAVPLLKLHGSLNWAHCPELETIVPWTMNAYFQKYHWDMFSDSTHFVRLQISQHLANFIYMEKAVTPEPVLIPPTWNKVEHHRNLAGVWRRAATELGDAENIVIIGYSLPETDAFFKYLFALGTVGSNPLKRFWVFNPDSSGAVESRFRGMLGPGAIARFRYFPEKFENAIPILAKEFPGRDR